MDDEDEDVEKWKSEREKVLDEWSEIELMGRDALKQRADTTEQPTAESLTIDELYPLMVAGSDAKSQEDVKEAKTSYLDRIIQICLCRPAESSVAPLIYTHKMWMIRLSQVNYSDENGTHWLLLSEYYKTIAQLALESNETPCPRVGKHWQIVGFQGNNPATDFRGAGVLALLQLYSFSHLLDKSLLKSIVDLSREEPNDFPLAVVSINMTGILLSRLKEHKFDNLGNPSHGLYDDVARLHAACVVQFCAQYKSQHCTLADCQKIISDIELELDKSPRCLIQKFDNNSLANVLLLK